ncbi:MAG TPA: rhodanese-like domain-containing protein [Cytophagales bacterium]|nr:rhodanese-like domain-containing protein [Cytophagales bacterium]HAA20770.1 rhodanese-like domain-containing protein [Cytophagales bacterium]HAP62072.1 rhodanese-like domain-containing protein [Cytophagales bacterium]
MQRIFIVALLFTTLTGFVSCAQSYDAKLAQLYQNTVPVITVDSLDAWMASRNIALLDTRQLEEYEISHLPGASFVDYDAFSPDQITDLDRNQPVVVYCSVGYRSERIGEQLQELGFSEVYNLYGGIFQWKNEGKIVVDTEGQETDKVHTYNKHWGKWLTNGVKVH